MLKFISPHIWLIYPHIISNNSILTLEDCVLRNSSDKFVIFVEVSRLCIAKFFWTISLFLLAVSDEASVLAGVFALHDLDDVLDVLRVGRVALDALRQLGAVAPHSHDLGRDSRHWQQTVVYGRRSGLLAVARAAIDDAVDEPGRPGFGGEQLFDLRRSRVGDFHLGGDRGRTHQQHYEAHIWRGWYLDSRWMLC